VRAGSLSGQRGGWPWPRYGPILRSRVGRRILLLFILSALLPVAVLTLLTAAHIRVLEREQVRAQLAQEGAAYARGLWERLMAAHLQLGVQAAALRQGQKPAGQDGAMPWRQVALWRLQGEGGEAGRGAADVLPASDALREHLRSGASALWMPDPAGGMRLVRALDPAQLQRGVLVAELDEAYLWAGGDDVSDPGEVCVLDGQRHVLFCSTLEARQALQADAGVEPWLLDLRPLSLQARFAVPDWTVAALRLQPGGPVGWSQIVHSYLTVVLLALLLVLLLSLVQVRRTLVPLLQLTEGARRYAQQDFQATLPVNGNDEFAELAQAMNAMATRLGQQIQTLQALSEIDQHILARVELGEVIERVQQRLQELWRDAVSAVVVFDPQAADFGIVHLYSGAEGVTARLPTQLQPWLLERVARVYDGVWLDSATPDLPDFLNMMVHSGAQRILVLPIYWQERVHGLLALGLKEHGGFGPQEVQRARELGNRIGVALAAHARDEELKYRAYHDALTGLPNRALLIERLGQEIAHARRAAQRVAVLFLDLDRFKDINDSLGHDLGDQLLCQVAERLSACTREGDTVARLGGDEFVVLLPGLGMAQQAVRLATEMMTLLREPYMLERSENHVGVSVGVAVFPDDGTLATELLKKADMAMYRAKASGRNRIVFFEEAMNIAQQQRMRLERELRQALARRQFELHYRPRFRLDDGRLSGAQALLRWRHPELGWVEPERFLPLAEEIGLVAELTRWLFEEVCTQQALWLNAGLAIETVTVGLTPCQLQAGTLVQQVRAALHSAELPAHALALEIPEGALAERIDAVAEPLRELRRMGVALMLDEFSTGRASLLYLQHVPIDTIKISAAFVRGLGRDSAATSISYAIATLARALGKTVLAEGVETAEQAELLQAWGCELADGSYYSRVLSAAELEQLLTPSRPAEVL